MYSRFMAENIGAVGARAGDRAAAARAAPRREPAAPLRLGVPDGFLFLFVFDYLSTIQRKNPVGLIEAFKLRVRARRGPAAADQDDQRAAAPAGRGGGAVGCARALGHPRDRPLADRRAS